MPHTRLILPALICALLLASCTKRGGHPNEEILTEDTEDTSSGMRILMLDFNSGDFPREVDSADVYASWLGVVQLEHNTFDIREAKPVFRKMPDPFADGDDTLDLSTWGATWHSANKGFLYSPGDASPLASFTGTRPGRFAKERNFDHIKLNRPTIWIDTFSINGTKYELHRSFVDTMEEYSWTNSDGKHYVDSTNFIRHFRLDLRTSISGKMVIQPLATQDTAFGVPSPIWMGDLDGDGKLDLIIDMGNGDEESLPTLFLSSRARNGRLVRAVAQRIAGGC